MNRILIVIPTLFLIGCSRQTEDSPTKPLVTVKVARAETADVERTIQAPANIFPREQANISARITAPILSLKARKGDHIKAGQVLAILENKDVEAQRAEALANLADAEATLQKTSAATLPSDLERARGQLLSSEAALNQAQKNYDRRKSLFAQGAIPGRDFLTSETDLTQAKSAYEVAHRTLELIEQQSGRTDVRIAESRVQQAKARQLLAAAQLEFTELRSPLNGTVTEQFSYPGDMAKPDTPVFTVMDLSIAIARAQVAESDVGQVSRGRNCIFSQPDSGDNSAKGTVSVINQAVDPARRTVEVWCEIPNSRINLRAGLFGSVMISAETSKHAVVAPESAVQFKEGSRKGVVFVVDRQHIAHAREVEAVLIPGHKIQIIHGIEAGETLVTEGRYGLPDGVQVTFAGESK